MASHIGIELSPVACRIVEIGETTDGEIPETHVRSYVVTPKGAEDLAAHLRPLGRRKVAVVVWGTRNHHQQLTVGAGGVEKMRAEAMASAAPSVASGDAMLSDIAPVGNSPEGATRRTVLLAMAASSDVTAAVAPLREAGLRIRSVVTPADALTSLFRLRRAYSVPQAAEAYVALEPASTAIALLRDDALVASTELGWGFRADGAAAGEVRPRDEMAARLVDALTEFFTSAGAAPGSVRQVSICGGMPELRSMTIPLMERLDIEVETLDSLFGIDTTRLPEPAEEFRERCAELRLAWAVAAEWRAPIDLLRQRRRRQVKTALSRAAVVAGMAAGLGVGWGIQRSQWWRSTASPVAPAPKAVAAAPRPPATPIPAPAPVRPLPPQLPPPKQEAPSPPKQAPLPPPPRQVAPVAPIETAKAPSTPVPPAMPLVARATELAPRPSAPPAPAVSLPVPPAPPPPAPRAPAPLPRVPEPGTRTVEPQRPTEMARAQPAAPPVAPPVARAPEPAPTVSRAAPPAPRVTPPAPAPAPAPVPVPVPAPRVAPPAPAPVPVPAPRLAPPAPAPAAPPTPAPAPAVPAPRAVAPPSRDVSPPPTPAPPPPAPPPAPPQRQRETPPAPVPQRQAPPSPPPLPFDAVLGTILYSPDRKLAIIDGRIVGIGDDVRGARVVDITSSSVLLRDAQGRMRILSLSSSAR